MAKPKIETTLVKEAGSFVSELMKQELPPGCLFHNLNFTKALVNTIPDLASTYDLDQENVENILVAAWFFDSGYSDKKAPCIDKSLEILEKFLKNHEISKDRTKAIMQIIRHATLSASDASLPGQILHDARISYLGRKRFFKLKELLRAEKRHLYNRIYNTKVWEEIQYRYLVLNNFYTSAARKAYNSRKGKNIAEQRKLLEKARKAVTREKTGKDLGRGIDTLYRSSYRTHINLSAIADGKANMMISINTIILSVIITLSGASFTVSESFIVEHLRFTIPIFILLIGAASSVVFAILSARPKVTKKDIESRCSNKVSLLFFGNFLDIPMNAFIQHLNELKKDEERLYESMSIDIYQLGLVLKKKYKLLTISYNLFMVGLVLAVVSFMLIFIYTNG